MFPLFSPIIEKIEVVRKGDVRRAKLYYLRDRTGKSARIADRDRGDESDQYAMIEEAPAKEVSPNENAEVQTTEQETAEQTQEVEIAAEQQKKEASQEIEEEEKKEESPAEEAEKKTDEKS